MDGTLAGEGPGPRATRWHVKNVIMASSDPVAIDAASIDLINEANDGKNVFMESNHKDPLLQVDFAAEYTGKSKGYILEII